MTRFSNLVTAALAAAAVSAVASGAAAQTAPRIASPSDALISDVYVRSNALLSRIDLGTIRTGAPGAVEVFSHRDGTQGELIAAQSLQAGVNRDVRLALDAPRRHDLLVVLTVGGAVVAREVVNLEGGSRPTWGDGEL